MDRFTIESNTRIIPECAHPRILAEHLKVYEYVRNIVKNKLVLEVGFGDGYGSVYLAKTARKVIGIDYDRQVVSKARRKYRLNNLQFLYMDATKLGFKDESIDMACSFQVVEHIPAEHLLLYLGEVYRVLKDRGEFYLSTPNIVVNRKGKKTYKMNPAHYQEFTVNEIRKLLSSIFPKVDVFGL